MEAKVERVAMIFEIEEIFAPWITGINPVMTDGRSEAFLSAFISFSIG